MSFLAELKRRKVFRVAVVYAIVAWLLVQIADTTFEKLLLPDWLQTALIIFLIFGFPIALILAWAFEIRPDGTMPEIGAARPPVPPGWMRGGYLLLAATTLALGLWLGSLATDSSDIDRPPVNARKSVDDQPFDSTASLRLPLQLPNYADNVVLMVESRLAISPDGRQIAYIGFDGTDVHLYLKNADESVPRQVPKSAGAVTPFFSPDGEEVAYSAKGSFWRVSTSGTQNPVPIEAVPGFANGASWGDDGNIVFGLGYRSVLYSVPSSGGPATQITELAERERSHRHPNVLPGSDAIVFQTWSDPLGIWLLDRRTGNRRFLTDGMNPKYANNKLLFLRFAQGGYALWSADFDLETLEITSAPKPLVTESVGVFDVSKSGALIYARNRPLIKTTLSIIDESGNRDLILDARVINSPRFSPSGDLLAIEMADNDQDGIWILGPTTKSKPYLLAGNFASGPAWSLDGSKVAYSEANTGIVSLPVDFSQPPKTLIERGGRIGLSQFTQKGMLFGHASPQTQGDLFFLKNNNERITIDDDEYLAVGGNVSPNGRWVAYSKMRSFRWNVFVKSITGQGPSHRVSANGGSSPRWSHGGDELYYYSYNKLLRVAVNEDDAISFGDPEVVHELGGREGYSFEPFDISPDGKRYAILDIEYGEPPPPIYITNWQHELLSN